MRLRTGGPPGAPIDFLDAEEILDELCEEQLALSMNLACLEESVALAPRDPSTRAAIATLAARIQDLAALRDALALLQHATIEPSAKRLFVSDAPLADYVRGLYAWAHAVVRAFEHLARGLRVLEPDWALLRWRLDEAKNFHFDELDEPIRVDIATHGEELRYAVEHLFATARAVESHLDERFG